MGSQTSLKISQRGVGELATPSTLPLDPPLLLHLTFVAFCLLFVIRKQ